MSVNDETFAYSALSQELRSSPREIDALGELLTKRGLPTRVMVVCGQNILTKSNVVERAEDALGPLFVGRFDEVTPHAPVEVVEAARELAQSVEPDCILSVGGGSTTTVAKGLALLASTDKDLEDFRNRFEPPNKVIPPKTPLPEVAIGIVAVTTTMGFAETGRGGGAFAARDRTSKLSIAGDGRTTPKMIIIDGEALVTTPDPILKSTAVGQLRIAIESVTSNRHTPLGDALGLHAIRLLTGEFVAGWHQEVHQLLRIKSACYLAIQAMAAVGSLGINTGIAHQVGGVSEVAHGEANAVLLPHTIRFNAIEGADRLRLVAEAMGFGDLDDDPVLVVSTIANRIDTICEGFGIPRRLRDIGVPEDSLATIARATMGDHSISANPRPIRDEAEIAAILQAAF